MQRAQILGIVGVIFELLLAAFMSFFGAGGLPSATDATSMIASSPVGTTADDSDREALKDSTP